LAAVSGGDFNRFAALQYKTIIRLDGFKKKKGFQRLDKNFPLQV
jgi:hypothetical protein